MEKKEAKLKLLAELIRKKEFGDFTKYEASFQEDKTDDFTKEVILEYQAAYSEFENSVNKMIDKLIHHLGQ